MKRQVRRVIAVDIMDTLIHDPWREALEAATGLPAQEIDRRRDKGVWQKLETGAINETVYWQDMHARDIVVDPAVFHAVRRQGYAWLPGAQDLLHQLQRSGHTVVLATNYPVWIEELWAEWLAGHDLPMYASCLLGARKPSREFFAPLLTDFGADFGELILIDDTAANVSAIAKAGSHGIVHSSSSATVRALQELGVL